MSHLPPLPSDDALSLVLASFRLRGSVGAHIAVASPWGYAVPASHDLGLMVVLRGRIHLVMEGVEDATLELAPGDVVAMPNGDPFTLRDHPDTPVVPITETGACAGDRILQAGAQTEFILLRCALSGGCTNPVRTGLPRLIHCPASDGRSARWLEPTVRLLALETAEFSTGRVTVLNRLAEITFVHLIRAWLERQAPECGGWFRALTDPQLSRALAAFHAQPGRAWTLASLAAAAGTSRSVFAARFKTLTGDTALEYLTTWRVQRAKSMLEDSDTPLKQVVAMLGYTSEAAFRTAFKRRVGQTPGEYRAAVRNGHPLETPPRETHVREAAIAGGR
jgi:AraC-like DNA-binding protein